MLNTLYRIRRCFGIASASVYTALRPSLQQSISIPLLKAALICYGEIQELYQGFSGRWEKQMHQLSSKRLIDQHQAIVLAKSHWRRLITQNVQRNNQSTNLKLIGRWSFTETYFQFELDNIQNRFSRLRLIQQTRLFLNNTILLKYQVSVCIELRLLSLHQFGWSALQSQYLAQQDLTESEIYKFNMLTATSEQVQIDWTAEETVSLKDSQYCAASTSTQHTLPRPGCLQPQPPNIVDRLLHYLTSNVPDSDINALLVDHLLGLTPPISQESVRLVEAISAVIMRSINPTERWTLLVNSVRLFDKITKGNCQSYYSIITKYLLALAKEMVCDLQQMDVLVEELSKVKTDKLTTGEGHRVYPESIVLLGIIQGSVLREKRDYEWTTLINNMEHGKTLIRRIFCGLATELNGKNKRQYLEKLMKDCFTLSSSIQYPLAMTFITIANSQLLTYFLNCSDESREKSAFLSILGTMMERILLYSSNLPSVEFEQQTSQSEESEDLSCDICKSSTCRILSYYLIVGTSSSSRSQSQFNICRSCSLYAPSSRNFLLNLLPLILGTYHSNFQPEELLQTKILLILSWVQDLKNKPRQRQMELLLDKLEKTPIREKVKFFDTQFLAYMNFHSESTGLKYQLKNIFAYWAIELNADNYLRRSRALKEAANLIAVYEKEQMEQYREKIIKVLKNRTLDKHQSVRAEALKVAQILYNKTQEQQYFEMIIQALSDSNLKIRKSILTFFSNRIKKSTSIPPTLVIKLAQLTLDPYPHLSKLATNCISNCIFCGGDVEVRLAGLMENGIISKNKELLVRIVQAGLEGGVDAKGIGKLLKKILERQDINTNWMCFLEVLAEKSAKALENHLEKFLKLAEKYPNCCQVLNILNNLIKKQRKYTHKQTGYLQILLNILERNVLTQGEALVKVSLPILVKLNIAFKNEQNLYQTINKCRKYLFYILSKQQLNEEQIQHAQRSMMIVSMMSIGLTDSGVNSVSESQNLVSSYEQFMAFANSNHNSLKPKAIQSLCLFWKHNHRFLYFSESSLSHLTLDQPTTTLLFSSFLDRFLNFSSYPLPASTLTTISNLFLKTYTPYLSSPSQHLRLLIIRLIGQLISFGLVSPFDMAGIALCFMCDPDEEIRREAAIVVQKLDNRFLLKDFKRTAKDIIDKIVASYGEVIGGLQADQGKYVCFFQKLVVGERITSKKKLPANSKGKLSISKNAITFVKKIGQLITSCEDLANSQNQLLIQFCCEILECCYEFEKYDLIEVISSLNTSIQVNYRGLMKRMKSELKKDLDEEEQNSQEYKILLPTAQTLLKMLKVLNQLTNGRPMKSFINQIQSFASDYVEVNLDRKTEQQTGLGLEQLYGHIKQLFQSRSGRTNRFKKIGQTPKQRKSRSRSNRRQPRDFERSETKSIKSTKTAKSAPKTSLKDQGRSINIDNSYKKKLRGGRMKKYKYVADE